MKQLELFPLEDNKFTLYSGDVVTLIAQDDKYVHFRFADGREMAKNYNIFDIMICKNPLGLLL